MTIKQMSQKYIEILNIYVLHKTVSKCMNLSLTELKGDTMKTTQWSSSALQIQGAEKIIRIQL